MRFYFCYRSRVKPHLVCIGNHTLAMREALRPKIRRKSISMPAPRIVIEQFPNGVIRTFHVNERISSEKLYDSLPGADALARFAAREHNPSTIQTALSFYEVEGVTSVGLDIYEVRVTIGRAFDWADITPQVIDLIKKHLCWDDAEVRDHDSRPVYSLDDVFSGIGLDLVEESED